MNPKFNIIFLIYFLLYFNLTNQFSFIKGNSGQTFIDQSIFYKDNSNDYYIVSKDYTDTNTFTKYLTKSDNTTNIKLTNSLTTDNSLFAVNTYHSYIYQILVNSGTDVKISYENLSSITSSSTSISFSLLKTISNLSCDTSKKCYAKIFIDNTNIYFTFISGSGKFQIYYTKASTAPSISQMSISSDYSFSSSEYTQEYSCAAYTNPLQNQRWGLLCIFGSKSEVVFFSHSSSPVKSSLTCPLGKIKYFNKDGKGYIIIGCITSHTLTVYYASYNENAASNPDIGSLKWNAVTSISGCANTSTGDLDISLDASDNILFVACSNADTITSINEVYSDAIIIYRITEFGTNNKIFQQFLLKSVVENFPVLPDKNNNFVKKINDLTFYNTGNYINLHYDFNLDKLNKTSYFYYSFIYEIYYKQCNDLIVTARINELTEIDFSKSLNLNTQYMGKFNITFLYFEDIYKTFKGTLYNEDNKTVINLDNSINLPTSLKYYYRLNESEVANKNYSSLNIKLNYLGYMIKDTTSTQPYPLECELIFTICKKYEKLNNGECLNCKNSNTYFYDDKCLSNKTGYALVDTTYNALEKCGETCKTCDVPPEGIIQNCVTCFKGQTLDKTYLYCSGSIIKEDSGNQESSGQEDSADAELLFDKVLLAKVATLVCNNGFFIKPLQNIIIVFLTIFFI
jgi:hypothetical protein